MIEFYNNTGEIDDQKILNIIYKTNSLSKISIDFKNLFFKVIGFDIIDRDDYNQHSYFIHRPANGSLINFLEKNGYTINFDEKLKLTLDSFNMLTNKSQYHTFKYLNSLNN